MDDRFLLFGRRVERCLEEIGLIHAMNLVAKTDVQPSKPSPRARSQCLAKGSYYAVGLCLILQDETRDLTNCNGPERPILRLLAISFDHQPNQGESGGLA